MIVPEVDCLAWLALRKGFEKRGFAAEGYRSKVWDLGCRWEDGEQGPDTNMRFSCSCLTMWVCQKSHLAVVMVFCACPLGEGGGVETLLSIERWLGKESPPFLNPQGKKDSISKHRHQWRDQFPVWLGSHFLISLASRWRTEMFGVSNKSQESSMGNTCLQY